MSRFSFRSWNSDHSELHKRRACFCRSGENAVSTDGMAAEATRGRDAGEGQQATKALTRLARAAGHAMDCCSGPREGSKTSISPLPSA